MRRLPLTERHSGSFPTSAAADDRNGVATEGESVLTQMNDKIGSCGRVTVTLIAVSRRVRIVRYGAGAH